MCMCVSCFWCYFFSLPFLVDLFGILVVAGALQVHIVVEVGRRSLVQLLLSVQQGRLVLGGHARRTLVLLDHVGVDEEVREEHKVAKVHHRRPEDVLLGDGTAAARRLRHIGLVVDVAAGDHLQDLRRGDHLRDEAGHLDAHGLARVVRVHHRVHKVVHGHEPAARRRKVLVRVPAVDEHGGVVVPVEEDELLLAQHDEHRVDELGQLAHDEHVGPEAGDAVAVAVVADRLGDALVRDDPGELGQDADGAQHAEQRQEDVPGDEGRAALEARSGAHHAATDEHEGAVGRRNHHTQRPVADHPRVKVLAVLLEEALEAEDVRVEL